MKLKPFTVADVQRAKWLSRLLLFVGLALCIMLWRSPVQFVQRTFSDSNDVRSFEHARYIGLFALGVLFVWLAMWASKQIAKNNHPAHRKGADDIDEEKEA